MIGSSGTIRNIEKVIFLGYASNMEGNVSIEESRRDWSFTTEELKGLVERLSEDERRVGGKVRKQGFFKKRSEFIVVGAVLLEEISKELKIEEMWRSIVKLVTRFNNKQRMKSAALCFSVAKEMFNGLGKKYESGNGSDGFVLSLEDKDVEYLEAACLLHKIISNDDHLHGYNEEEVKLIALLVWHHRKKLPECDHVVPEELTEEMRGKFRILCAILRVSAAVEKLQLVNLDNVEFSHTCEGYILVLEAGNLASPGNVLPSVKDFEAELGRELEHFRMVFQERLSIAVTSSTSS
ncbi:hypothetical protein K7X08_036422 [Anisodus acutangulus]|uniref:Uncharacterized protein n=1 Tax=Anisodus acutangulus TaxID=402998 RepID=A0A9Q1QY20_9SOLA|nr:hypothetical protein K7X08_036422 [Anisodus acutangulus]